MRTLECTVPCQRLGLRSIQNWRSNWWRHTENWERIKRKLLEKPRPFRFAELQIAMTLSNCSFPSKSTSHGNQSIKDLMVCPPFPNVDFQIRCSSLPSVVNASLNVPLAVATTFTNLVVLLAMRRVTSIRLPSKLLLCSLVLTDLGAGAVVAPQHAAWLFHQAINPDIILCSLLKAFVITSSLFGWASLWTLAAMSLDRYAALFFYLKYQQIVTTRRVCAVLAFIWALAILFALTSVTSSELWYVAIVPGIVIPLLVISVACIKISRRLLAGQIQPQASNETQQQAGNTLNRARYRRTASAMIIAFVLLLICYLPFLFRAILTRAIERNTRMTCLIDYSNSIILLNSLLNPFVYCLRLPEIRTEVVKQLRKLFCRSSSGQWTEDKDWKWAYLLVTTKRVRSVDLNTHYLNSASQQIVSATSIMLASFELVGQWRANGPVAGVRLLLGVFAVCVLCMCNVFYVLSRFGFNDNFLKVVMRPETFSSKRKSLLENIRFRLYESFIMGITFPTEFLKPTYIVQHALFEYLKRTEVCQPREEHTRNRYFKCKMIAQKIKVWPAVTFFKQTTWVLVYCKWCYDLT